MSRIRSVHPSIFTDERWVSCSPLARVLYIGLLTEADDQGVFEWKPLQIKMRVLPGDDARVPDLLEELVLADLIAPFETDGKGLGAIRNFCKFQRPKKPTAKWPLPDKWRTYVGADGISGEPSADDDGDLPPSSPTSGEPVPHQIGTPSETGEQKKEGGRRKGVTPPKPPRGPFPPEFVKAFEAYPVEGTATTSLDHCIEPWSVEAAAVGPSRLLAAVEAFAASPAAVGPRAKAAPAFHIWLSGRRYHRFLPKDAPAWDGPPEIRAAVVEALGPDGESFAKAVLDGRCGWQDGPVKAVICPTSWTRAKLTEGAVGEVFRAKGVQVIRQEGAAA